MFSPDSQCFYDMRQSTCSIWESDTLMRSDESELEDQSSMDDISIATEPVISHNEFDQGSVTVLAPDTDGRHYCCGWEDSITTIHETVESKRIHKRFVITYLAALLFQLVDHILIEICDAC